LTTERERLSALLTADKASVGVDAIATGGVFSVDSSKGNMKYADTVARTARSTVRNPFAVVLVSVAASASALPFITGFLFAGLVGGLVGLWTTSFALGFVAVGGARIATVTLEREVSLGTEYFWEGIRHGRQMGLTVGFGTFIVLVIATLAVSNPLNGVIGLSLALVGVYTVLAWFTLVTFALAFWASLSDHDDVRKAFIEGGTLILEKPHGAGWLLVQTVGWTLLAIPLIIAPVLVLPGFVQMLGVCIVRTAASESASHSITGLSDN
jgi:hypothetical protein